MAQIIKDGYLLLSQSELKRFGLTASDFRALGQPDATMPNPHGYSHAMRLYSYESAALMLPAGVERCKGCGYVSKGECPCTLAEEVA